MRLALILGALGAGDLLFIFLIQWYVLVHVGPGIESDALFASLTLPQLLLAILSSSLTNVLVPLLSGGDEESTLRDAWVLIIVIGGLFICVAAGLFVTKGIWVPLMFPGFSPQAKDLTITLTGVQLVSMVFYALLGVLWSVYYGRRKFIWAEFSPLPSGALAFLFLICTFSRYGIIAAAWTFVLKVAIQTSLLFPGIGKYRKSGMKNPIFGKIWKNITPLLLGSTFYKSETVVDRFLASMAPPGELSLLYLGQRILNAANHIVNKAVAAPMISLLAKMAKEKNFSEFRRYYKRRLVYLLWGTISCLILFLLIGQSALNLLIGYGKITSQNVETLWLITLALFGTLVGGAVGQITSNSFYAKENTRTPTKIGILGFSFGVILKVIGFLKWGVIGIALGTSIYYLFSSFLLVLFLERDMCNFSKLEEIGR